MNVGLLLDMAADSMPDRILWGSRDEGLTASDIRRRAQAGAAEIRRRGAAHVVYVGVNDLAFPLTMLSAAVAGVPFLPLNYRLVAPQLRALIEENTPVLAIADPAVVGPPAGSDGDGQGWLSPAQWLRLTQADTTGDYAGGPGTGPEDVAILLYTSGTTATPKAAVLRHRHLASYVLGTVEFAAADESEAALVSVPPYHIAGVSNALSNLYAGRRVVQLPSFTPDAWLDTLVDEGITHALVVPTMLSRIVDHLDGHSGESVAYTRTLRTLAYGGAPMPQSVIERALRLFPETGFVNAYGLTETSSTIALLGPDEHREAAASSDPYVRARLTSVGRAIPGVEIDIRGEDGAGCPADVVGDLWVRGPQVSGEYRGREPVAKDGWFPTRDRARLDRDGFLYVEGRTDDTIIRGGENIAPAEIEDVLRRHPEVADAAVIGLPDPEWGQRIGAAVVPRVGCSIDVLDLGSWARAWLRSSKSPEVIVVVAELPRTDTGKLIRRQVAADVAQACTAGIRDSG